MNPDPRGRQRLPTLTQLGMAFSTATLVFALPVYERLSAGSGVPALLGLVLWVQLLPTAAIFALSMALFRSSIHGRRPRVFWTLLAILSLLSIVRVIQTETPILDPGMPDWPEATALAFAVLVPPAMGRFADLAAPRLLGSVAPAFLAITAAFVVHWVVQELPPSPPPAPASPGRSDSLYILIFDELGRDVLLRDGSIDGEKFPHFKALAQDSIWFANATANHYYTCQSIYTMMSGSFGRGARQDDWPLLVTLGQYYRFRTSSTYLNNCNIDSRYDFQGLPYLVASHPDLPLFRHWLPAMVRDMALNGMLQDFWHTYRWAQFQDFLDSIKGPDARGSAFLFHLLLPHWPYVYAADGAQHRSPYQTFRDHPAYDAVVYRNYEQQAMLVDALLGRFLDRLRQQGLYDDATIVVTSDHGPRVIDHFVASPLSGISRQMPYVPLLIHSPRLSPGVSSIDYQHIDLLPTLLELLQIPDGGGRNGVSAFSADRPQRQKRFTWADRAYVYQPETDLWAQVAGPSSP